MVEKLEAGYCEGNYSDVHQNCKLCLIRERCHNLTEEKNSGKIAKKTEEKPKEETKKRRGRPPKVEVEEAKVETPKKKTPVVKKAEEPKAEEPKVEEPKVEEPKVETPKKKTPVAKKEEKVEDFDDIPDLGPAENDVEPANVSVSPQETYKRLIDSFSNKPYVVEAKVNEEKSFAMFLNEGSERIVILILREETVEVKAGFVDGKNVSFKLKDITVGHIENAISQVDGCFIDE